MSVYARLAMIGLLLGAFGATGWFAYSAGKDAEKAANAVNIEEAREEERAKVKTVIEYREKLKVVYRDKIKRIQSAQDNTGCADVLYTDMGFILHQDSQN